MIPLSETRSQAEGATKRLDIQLGRESACSVHVATESEKFSVRVRTGEAQVLVRMDVELIRRQQEIREANEEIKRRMRG
jgi:hypothetical protein